MYMSLTVLHICSDFAKQGIYNQLVTQLSKLGINQKVYVPVRTSVELEKNRNLALSNVQYEYSFLLRGIDRINYFRKIKKTSRDLLNRIDIEEVGVIHAHFLFSDGGNAYNLYKKFGIPYVVAVRNTDVNVFFKYFIHLRRFGLKILENASRIVFLSKAYEDVVFEKYVPNSLRSKLASKSCVIPNGINEYWLNNLNFDNKVQKAIYEILYVGDFSKNKNIQTSIKSLTHLQQMGETVNFTIVGGGGNYAQTILNLAKQNSTWITLVNRIENIEELKKVYRKADIFLMPSIHETFGLVYIEALSQGLPVVYSKGQGIDGYFEEGHVGYSVDPNDYLQIADKIRSLKTSLPEISNNCVAVSKNFSWDRVALMYKNIYEEFN